MSPTQTHIDEWISESPKQFSPDARQAIYQRTVCRVTKRAVVLVALLELADPVVIPPLLISQLDRLARDIRAVSELLISRHGGEG